MKKGISLLLVLIACLSMTVSASADSLTLYSDTSVTVYGPLNEYKPINDPAWGTAHGAVQTWVHPSWPTLDPAKWLSNTYYIEGNIAGNTWRWFQKTVALCEYAYDVSGTVRANSDNAEEVYVNGAFVGSEGAVQGPSDTGLWWKFFKDYNFEATGDNLVFDFIVRNYDGSSVPTSNPTGLIYSIDIDYSCSIEVVIDIKPASSPSCFNNDGNGIIPVAIFGSESFDVREVDVSTVLLEGLPVATKPNGKYMAAYQEMNGDGFEDLVVKFEDLDGVFEPGDEYATLTGELLDGTHFFSVGDICVRH